MILLTCELSRYYDFVHSTFSYLFWFKKNSRSVSVWLFCETNNVHYFEKRGCYMKTMNFPKKEELKLHLAISMTPTGRGNCWKCHCLFTSRSSDPKDSLNFAKSVQVYQPRQFVPLNTTLDGYQKDKKPYLTFIHFLQCPSQSSGSPPQPQNPQYRLHWAVKS